MENNIYDTNNMLDKLVKNSIYLSLVVQIITTLISLDGFSIKIQPKDNILRDILGIEAFVQVVEAFFYIWVILALHDTKLMTPRRYLDWMITTPIMLITTIMFMKYNENKNRSFTITEFIQTHKEDVIQLFIYNGLMLLFGYLAETNVIPKHIGIAIGFFFFFQTFKIIYKYAEKTDVGKKLFNFLTIVWALYGVAAMLPMKQKNICYNMLDIISKNFYGLYIYYQIKAVRVS